MNFKQIVTLLLITLVFCGSCKTEGSKDETLVENQEIDADTLSTEIVDTVIVSDYDISAVDADNVEGFKENLVKIEKKFGVQWDFCTCVVKGDSLNEAFKNPDLPDTEFNALYERLDFIDEKCKAFKIQNSSKTPEERAAHEKEVKKCLKAAGL